MQRLEVSGAVRPIYGSLGVKRLMNEIASLRYDPSIYMERRKKNTEGPGKDSRPSGQDFRLQTSKRVTEFLFTDSDRKLKTVSFKMALLLTADVSCYRHLFARKENHRPYRLL